MAANSSVNRYLFRISLNKRCLALWYASELLWDLKKVNIQEDTIVCISFFRLNISSNTERKWFFVVLIIFFIFSTLNILTICPWSSKNSQRPRWVQRTNSGASNILIPKIKNTKHIARIFNFIISLTHSLSNLLLLKIL